jgi:hypothetical protein
MGCNFCEGYTFKKDVQTPKKFNKKPPGKTLRKSLRKSSLEILYWVHNADIFTIPVIFYKLYLLKVKASVPTVDFGQILRER